MPDSRKIEDELCLAVRVAQQRLWRANEKFSEVIKEIPSALPAPDGALRIHLAGVEKRHALRALDEAVKRLNRVVLYRKMPQDLDA